MRWSAGHTTGVGIRLRLMFHRCDTQARPELIAFLNMRAAKLLQNIGSALCQEGVQHGREPIRTL